jgi:DNA invertase Pin-like site-specific DNA recombinase
VIPTISYGRVSSEKQLSGEGLRRQREGTLAWIAKHAELNIRLDAELEDRARSAWKGDHILKDDAALGKILEMVKSGELQPPLLIIVEALDRFSRENRWVAHNRLSGLVAAGIFVATTKDDKIYHLDGDISDMIVSVVYMVAAHKESEDRSFRVRQTKQERIRDAMQTKHVLHQNCPAWMVVSEKISTTNRGTRQYKLIERNAATVLLIYTMALHHGAAYVTRWLIEHKVEPFGRTGQWTLRYVKNILRSRAPIGHLKSKHGMVDDLYPRVPGLTDELWLAVQAAQDARRDNGAGTPYKSQRVNLLVGIGRCDFCGGKMKLSANGLGFHYYGCNTRAVNGKTACANRFRYRQDIIEDALLDRFGMGWLEARPRKVPMADLKSLDADLDRKRAREARLAGRLKELDDDQMFDLVMTQLRELRSQVTDAATRLQAARQAAALVTVTPVKLRDLTDRAAIATALKQQLIGVRFGPDNHVVLEGRRHVLTVQARAYGEKPKLAFKVRRDGPAPRPLIRLSPRAPVEVKTLAISPPARRSARHGSGPPSRNP